MLDFYLLGIARSGTTAANKTINLHPEIYCGGERFSIGIHPESIKFPESFLDASIKGHPVAFLDEQASISKMTKSKIDSLHVIGDKQPKKIYVPSHLAIVKTNLFIYRSYKQVCLSWDVRAKDKNDCMWPQYLTGYLFFFDLFVFLFFIKKINNLNCVEYEACFYGDFEFELAIWFNALGVSLKEYPVDCFVKQIYKKRPLRSIRNIDKRYQAFADLIDLPEFEKKYHNYMSNIERLNSLMEYSEYVQNNHVLFMNKYFELLSECEYAALKTMSNKIKKYYTNEEKDQFVSSNLDYRLLQFFSKNGIHKM